MRKDMMTYLFFNRPFFFFMLLLVPLALLFKKIGTLWTQTGPDGHTLQAEK
jgi:hypothetical protein